MRHLLYILTVVIMLCLHACSGGGTAGMLDRAEALIDSARYDEALCCLDSIDTLAFTSRKGRARFGLLKARARYKLGRLEARDDSALRDILDYFDQTGDTRSRMHGHYLRGYALQQGRNDSTAIREYLRAADLASELRDSFTLGMTYHFMGEILNYYRLTREEKYYDNLSVEMMKSQPYIYLVQSHIAYAYACNNNLEFEEAINIGKLYLDTLTSIKDTLLLESCIRLLCTGFHESKEYAKSNEYFDMLTHPDESDLFLNIYNNVLWGNLHRADSLVLRYSLTSKDGKGIPPEYWEAKCDFQKAYNSGREEYRKNNHEFWTYTTQSITSAINEHETNLTIENQKIADKRLIWIILLALTLFITWSALTIRHLYRKSSFLLRLIGIYQIEKDIDQITESLNTTMSDNSFMTNLIANLDAVFSTFQELEAIQITKGKNRLDKLYAEIFYNLKENEENLTAIEQFLNANYNNAIAKYRQTYPKVRDEEIMMLYYLLLGFAPSTISMLMGISEKAYYSRKARIKVKILGKRIIDDETASRVFSDKPKKASGK